MYALPVSTRSFRAWRWWEPRRPGVRWFYASPRRGPLAGRADVRPETVDPELRALVAGAHARGWMTFPSCAGHRVTRAGARAVLAALQSDAEQVRGEGLWLRDSESGQERLWRSDRYVAPSPQTFWGAMRVTHGRGVFGVSRLARSEVEDLAHAGRRAGFSVEAVGADGLQLHLCIPDDTARAHAWHTLLPAVTRF